MSEKGRKPKTEPVRSADELQRGARIRRLRSVKKWNQEEFAQQIGVDQSTVSDIERGAGFSAELLMRMADKLGVTPSLVMRGHDEAFWPFQFVQIDEFTGLDAEKRSMVEGRLMEYLSLANPPNPPKGSSIKPAARQQVTRLQKRSGA